MPAARLSRRRKSSHALFSPAKPGIYGIPQRPVTFAPNVTPVTFGDTDDLASDLFDPSDPRSTESLSPTAKLFPPSATPAPAPSRKRCPPGKRRSQGYIPRPPNAFMLFRADFVRQKHVPGSIETNHGSLSKIIGTCWRQLPLEEKRVWEVRAKHEKAAHKAQFPDYRFRPVHNKNKNANANNNGNSKDHDERREKQVTTLEDERRCGEVAQLLLEGKKGDELAQAVRNLDRARERELAAMAAHQSSSQESSVSPSPRPQLHMPVPSLSPGAGFFAHNQYGRRPSSVPLPNEYYNQYGVSGIAMPSLSFLHGHSRSGSPVASISRQGFLSSQQQDLQQRQQQHEVQHGQGFTFPFAEPAFAPNGFSEADPGPFAFPHPFGTRGSIGGRASFAFGMHFQGNNASSSNTSGNANTANAPITLPLPFPHAHLNAHPTPGQRASLGARRASSAQPLMRSWGADDVFNAFAPYAAQALPMPVANDYGMANGRASFGMGMSRASFGMGSFSFGQWGFPGMDMGFTSSTMGMGMEEPERDPSPLPDVAPLFEPDFSFGSSAPSATTNAAPSSAPQTMPVGDESVSPVSVSPVSRSPVSVSAEIGPCDVAPDAAQAQTQGAYDPAPQGGYHAHGHSHSHSSSQEMWAPDAVYPASDAAYPAADAAYSTADSAYPSADLAYAGKPLGMDGPMQMEMELGMSLDGMGMGVGVEVGGFYSGY